MLWDQITTFMVGIRRPKAQPSTSFEWPGMTHSCSHRIDLHIPEHSLLLQLSSHALANASSPNQAAAKPVCPTASRASDLCSDPLQPFPSRQRQQQTLHCCVDLCCSTGCSRVWQRNGRDLFSIWKRLFLCKPAQLLLLQGKRQPRDQGNKWVSH